LLMSTNLSNFRRANKGLDGVRNLEPVMMRTALFCIINILGGGDLHPPSQIFVYTHPHFQITSNNPKEWTNSITSRAVWNTVDVEERTSTRPVL